jgi:hypothetical protein
MLTVPIELWEQLLPRERELESREGAILAWQDGLAAFECTLRMVCMECDGSRIQAEAA